MTSNECLKFVHDTLTDETMISVFENNLKNWIYILIPPFLFVFSRQNRDRMSDHFS